MVLDKGFGVNQLCSRVSESQVGRKKGRSSPPVWEHRSPGRLLRVLCQQGLTSQCPGSGESISDCGQVSKTGVAAGVGGGGVGYWGGGEKTVHRTRAPGQEGGVSNSAATESPSSHHPGGGPHPGHKRCRPTAPLPTETRVQGPGSVSPYRAQGTKGNPGSARAKRPPSGSPARQEWGRGRARRAAKPDVQAPRNPLGSDVTRLQAPVSGGT